MTGKFEGEEVVVFDSATEGEYPEPVNDGHHIIIDPPVPGRYVRDQANGSTGNQYTHWMEIEVYGTLSETSVSSKGKLATTWGNIKAGY